MRIKPKSITSRGGNVVCLPPSGGPMSYVKRVSAFRIRMGIEDGNLPVVKFGQDEWDEWMAYFMEIKHPFGKQGSFARRHGVMTVPTKHPDDFEPLWRVQPIIEPSTDKDAAE